MNILCTNCKQPYPHDSTPFRCPRCGGLFDYAGTLPYNPTNIEDDQPGIWRYRRSFDLPEDAAPVSLGEGNTPLVWAPAFGQRVAFKCEYQNPTGSFKDRGCAPIAAFLRQRGVKIAVEDSSGNAGASFAAYAARAGIQARVFIPDSASGPKRQQIEAYGAQVVRIMGSRTNATKAALRAIDKNGGSQGILYESLPAYASHAYLPFNLPGYATLAYELVEQMEQSPGSVLVPVGQGGLLLGIGRGFESLRKAGIIAQVPRLVGVQARACAPLWAVYSYGQAGMSWAAEAPTLAEGIRVLQPLRGDAVLAAVNSSQGIFVAVDEENILPGRDELARLGLYVEPTSAVVWDALRQTIDCLPGPVAVVLTGSGLKSGA